MRMRKTSSSRSGQPAPASQTQLQVRPAAGASCETAIAHRIRALRAEARAVYAEMAAAVLVNKQGKK
jgi:hypothetical protein